MQDIPTLRDLETSNQITNKFFAENAPKYARQGLKNETLATICQIEEKLACEDSITFEKYAAMAFHGSDKEQPKAEKAAMCFMDLLSFSQMGVCEILQDKTKIMNNPYSFVTPAKIVVIKNSAAQC